MTALRFAGDGCVCEAARGEDSATGAFLLTSLSSSKRYRCSSISRAGPARSTTGTLWEAPALSDVGAVLLVVATLTGATLAVRTECGAGATAAAGTVAAAGRATGGGGARTIAGGTALPPFPIAVVEATEPFRGFLPLGPIRGGDAEDEPLSRPTDSDARAAADDGPAARKTGDEITRMPVKDDALNGVPSCDELRGEGRSFGGVLLFWSKFVDGALMSN